jgi:hypothetical protein
MAYITKQQLFSVILLCGLISTSARLGASEIDGTTSTQKLCGLIGNKLSSVSSKECMALDLQPSGHASVNDKVIGIRDYPPIADRHPLGKILFVSGIHGDEYAAVSVTFKWMHILKKHHSGLFHWRFAPLMNPDGLLQKRSQRINANGVDLNRNFPTNSWNQALVDYWEKRTGKNKRRYPGPHALSEPESRWLLTEMANFQPDVVISVHAPHGIVDFDGPRNTAPEKLGDLNLKLLGTYPGSLGNYANTYGGMPVVTMELPHAGIMPSNQHISAIWTDLIRWLRSKVEWKAPQKTLQASDDGEDQNPV